MRERYRKLKWEREESHRRYMLLLYSDLAAENKYILYKIWFEGSLWQLSPTTANWRNLGLRFGNRRILCNPTEESPCSSITNDHHGSNFKKKISGKSLDFFKKISTVKNIPFNGCEHSFGPQTSLVLWKSLVARTMSKLSKTSRSRSGSRKTNLSLEKI